MSTFYGKLCHILLRKFLLASLFLGLIAMWHSVPANELSFGVYTSDNPIIMVNKFKPMLKVLESALEKKLNKPISIRILVARTYGEGVDDLINGKVDFARFGPVSYIHAKEAQPGISILAIESKKGKKTFNGIICVAKESPIRNIKELKGKRFAFGNRNSTIGRYLSQLYLLERGIRHDYFGTYVYLGHHNKVGMAVASGKVDAGALKEGTFKSLLKKGKSLRKIAEFPNVTKPWIARQGLPKAVKTAIREVLLSMNMDKDSAALKALKKDGFLPGSDEDYAVIREAIRHNGKFFSDQ